MRVLFIMAWAETQPLLLDSKAAQVLLQLCHTKNTVDWAHRSASPYAVQQQHA